MTKFKVLMADSNPQMLSMMKEYFTAQENVSVFDTVTDGVSALEALHKTRYDVLITELIMPRADGFEIMERIAAGLVSDAPAVMVVSTMRSEDMVRRACSLGAKYYMVKPPSRKRYTSACWIWRMSRRARIRSCSCPPSSPRRLMKR